MISNVNYCAHTSQLYKNLQMLKIEDLYVYQVNLFVYKLKNNLSPNCMGLVLFNNKQCYSFRVSGDVLQNYCRTNVTKRFIIYAAVNIWSNYHQLKRNNKSIHV